MGGIQKNFNKTQFKNIKKKNTNKNLNYNQIAKINKKKKQKREIQTTLSTLQIQTNLNQKMTRKKQKIITKK